MDLTGGNEEAGRRTHDRKLDQATTGSTSDSVTSPLSQEGTRKDKLLSFRSYDCL